MQCVPRLCRVLKFHCKPNYPLSRRTLRMPSRVPRISRLAVSRFCVCLPTMKGCPPPRRKSRLSLTSISFRPPLSISRCRRRNSLLVLSVMFVSLHVSRPLSRVPPLCHHSRVSRPCNCHSRSHQFLTRLNFTPSSRFISESRASPEESSSSRSEHKWCNRDERIWRLLRRE